VGMTSDDVREHCWAAWQARASCQCAGSSLRKERHLFEHWWKTKAPLNAARENVETPEPLASRRAPSARTKEES